MSIEIPTGWTSCEIGEVSKIVSGGTPPSKDLTNFTAEGGIPWITPADLSGYKDIYISRGRRNLSEKGFSACSAAKIPPGSVLFSSRAPVGYVAIASNEVTTSQGFKSFVLSDELDSRFVYFYLRHIKPIAEKLATGTTFKELSGSAAARLPLIVAPLNEQRRIADKLDRLLARVDACRARCDRIPLILKRFRQSVLAFAVSGELTEDWRENNSSVEEFDSDQTPLPMGWMWKLIREVGSVQLGRQRAPKYHSGEYMRPYLRVQNIFEDRIDLSDVMEMDFPPDDFERYQLHFGDILLNEGQSPEFLGRPAMYRDDLPGACFTNTLIRFQAFDIVNRDFALLVFRHYMHCGRFRREGTITTNIAHLGAGRFANIEFPLPPLEEQQEIVRRAEKLLAFADRFETRYKTARAQVDRLTPASLDKAFQGELVPQDPNDEPASVLLEQIRSELAVAKANKIEGQRDTVISIRSIAQVIMLTRKDIQPSHLSSLLKARGPLTAETLWAESQLEIDDFYDQLKDEEAQGLLRESRVEEPNALRLLEAA